MGAGAWGTRWGLKVTLSPLAEGQLGAGVVHWNNFFSGNYQIQNDHILQGDRQFFVTKVQLFFLCCKRSSMAIAAGARRATFAGDGDETWIEFGGVNQKLQERKDGRQAKIAVPKLKNFCHKYHI